MQPKIKSFLVLLLLAKMAVGQVGQEALQMPFSRLDMVRQRYILAQDSSAQQHAVFPLLVSDVDSLFYEKNYSDASLFGQKKFDPTIRLNEGRRYQTNITAYPLFDVMQGFEGVDGFGEDDPVEGFNTTALGGHIGLSIGKRFTLQANYIEYNSKFPLYYNSYIDKNEVVPGQGYAYKLGGDRYHYRDFNGYLAYSPGKHFHFQLGRGKNFIGDGYRSLLLSDYGSNYDYLKITTDVWKVRYTNLYTHMKDIQFSDGNEASFKEKYMTMHYLSIQPFRWLNMGVFEAVIWQAEDSISQRGFDVNYLNPIIFYRPVEFSVGSPDNVLVGANVNSTISKSVKLYGQLLLDEFKLSEIQAQNGWWANKYSIQIGGYYFNAFKIDNLTLQGEYNFIRPFTYSHANYIQNYGHFNEPLAHPAGASAQEFLILASIFKKRWFVEGKLNVTLYDDDMGSDIFESYNDREENYGYYTATFEDNKIYQVEFRVNYVVHALSNTQLEFRMGHRSMDVAGSGASTTYAMLGIKTAIFNRYTDF